MISLKHISKTYGSKENSVEALKDVSIDIEDGIFVVITGKSGSGKSTLMNIIGALDKPTSGSVIVDNQDISLFSDNELSRYRNKNIGFVFQSFYLEPAFSVLENVCMPLTIAGELSKKEREERAIELLKKLGLEDKINKKANELSGGQKQRASIARALISNPSLILADEPTGNLDSQNGLEVMKILRGLVDEGKTVILVTHNLEDAKNGDLLINIKDGEIVSIVNNKKEETASL